MQGPQVVLDLSAVRAFADGDPRVHELVDMLDEDALPVRVLSATLAEATRQETAPEAVVWLKDLRHRSPAVLPEEDTVRRATVAARLHGIPYAQSVAVTYAVDHYFYLATWTPLAVEGLTGQDLRHLIINLLSPHD